MAELFLATDERQAMVVIKRILPYLSHEPEFVQMFLDEARIAAQLHHPNIITVHELGSLNESIFIAMEFVEGVDIRKILQEEVKVGLALPYGIVAYVTAQVAAGLAYAHTSRGMDGRIMEIIHRDVSPQNVMVSFDGRVKLVDFGIAKANSFMERSKPGVIKGKFLYLSPEQLSQERLDHRADLFALGTMIYELTTGKAPFYRTTTEAVIYAIRNDEPMPPTTVRSDYPPELSRIVMKCLVKDRNRRYQSALDIQRDLEGYLRTLAAPIDARAVSAYVTRLFGNEEERTLVHIPPAPTGSVNTTPAAPGLGSVVSGLAPAPTVPSAPPVVKEQAPEVTQPRVDPVTMPPPRLTSDRIPAMAMVGASDEEPTRQQASEEINKARQSMMMPLPPRRMTGTKYSTAGEESGDTTATMRGQALVLAQQAERAREAKQAADAKEIERQAEALRQTAREARAAELARQLEAVEAAERAAEEPDTGVRGGFESSAELGMTQPPDLTPPRLSAAQLRATDQEDGPDPHADFGADPSSAEGVQDAEDDALPDYGADEPDPDEAEMTVPPSLSHNIPAQARPPSRSRMIPAQDFGREDSRTGDTASASAAPLERRTPEREQVRVGERNSGKVPVRAPSRYDLELSATEATPSVRNARQASGGRGALALGIIAFVVVLALGLGALWLLHDSPMEEEPAPAPSATVSPPAHPMPVVERIPVPSDPPAPIATGEELSPAPPKPTPPAPVVETPPQPVDPPAPNPPVVVKPTAASGAKVAAVFRAPRGTLIVHDGQTYQPNQRHTALPGPYAYQYQCPGKRNFVNGTVTVTPVEPGGLFEITLACKPKR